MYFVTDNTMTKIERAFLIAAAQPTTANYSDLYSGNKGDIQFAEISLSFNGFFINNDFVYQKASDMLLAMRNPSNLTDSRIIVYSHNFKYAAITEAGVESGFDAPKYFSEKDGNAAGEKMSKIPNEKNLAYVNHQVGGTQGDKVDKDAGAEAYTYANTVYAMSGNEHVINNDTSSGSFGNKLLGF